MADYVVTASSVLEGTDAVVRQGEAGATVTAGMAVYVDGADSDRIKPADCTVEASSQVVGIALNSASTGQPIDYADRSQDFVTGFTAAVGDIVILSTGGSLCPAADATVGDYVVLCGVMTSTTTMNFQTNAYTRAASPII